MPHESPPTFVPFCSNSQYPGSRSANIFRSACRVSVFPGSPRGGGTSHRPTLVSLFSRAANWLSVRISSGFIATASCGAEPTVFSCGFMEKAYAITPGDISPSPKRQGLQCGWCLRFLEEVSTPRKSSLTDIPKPWDIFTSVLSDGTRLPCSIQPTATRCRPA